MEEKNKSVASKITQKRWGCLQVFGLMVIVVIITAGVTILVFKTYFFPSEFKPVTLNPAEEKVLAAKLENLDSIGAGVTSHKKDDANNLSKSDRFDPNTPLDPEQPFQGSTSSNTLEVL
ncbi:MAG: hypothetical protein SRB2_04257 [Desulfobacteraceae bacterium Eth-SRB2]|nr:MAG: hypothetical protein SRB2_04257 [Desulfobacteraceae bacterium Eth-SRB2]